MSAIETVLKNIKSGHHFDTHHVIDQMIRNHSDDYIRFVSKFAEGKEPTLTAHQQFGQEVAKFDGELIERQDGRSCSINIHGNPSECALWKRK
jgi:hypothetical protein